MEAFYLWSIIIVLGVVTMFSWMWAYDLQDEYKHEFSKRKIAIIQMLCIFWPIGLSIGIPYGLFFVTKKASLWFIRTTKIIFSPEKEEN